MKTKEVLLVLIVLFFSFSTVFAQDSVIVVPMKLIKGKNEYLGTFSASAVQKNTTGFVLPVKSELCKVGYYTLSPFHQSYYERTNSDSARKSFEMLASMLEIDTLQLSENKLKQTEFIFVHGLKAI